MYQRILIPVDGSPTSLRALQEALQQGDNATQVRLVHVAAEFAMQAEGYEFIDYEELRKAARIIGEHILADAAERVRRAGRAAETSLRDAGGERIASVIEDEAQRWQADLIVIGTHGRTGLNRLLMGSVAEGVVRVATVPVLLIRAE